MKILSLEKYIEKLGGEVYPITIMKFLLNKGRIQGYFRKASDPEYEIKYTYTIDNSDCDFCFKKRAEGILCRQHTSIDRVLNADNILLDIDTNTYFYKNEIFRLVDGKLVIIYCPHPKLISGDITDVKVRRVNPITVDDSTLPQELKYSNVISIMSSELLEQHVECWFNDTFTIVTIPEDRNKSNFCLVLNH